MRKIALLFIYTVAFLSQIYGQSIAISGRVIDKESKKGIQSITILLKNKGNAIIAFKMSDAEGNFLLQTNKDTTGAYLEINHLGYKRKKLNFHSSRQKIIIELEQNTILLEDVEVKSKPRIQQKGDTLSYNVSSFSKQEDRSIGDVLKRMPGIEVSESGQIKYQGKSISNFYIDGDDLLKNKYNIGTKTIAHNIVKDVQVLNNHEHLKVLKNKRYSDQVALNLVIKDEAKLSLSGQVKLGAGLPNQYDAEANTVLFNKKYKGLNVVKGNNIGNELKDDIVGFNSNNVLANFGRSTINNLLDLGTVGNPPIQQSHFLMNNSFGVNANNLFNFKNNWQVTSNIHGVFEKSKKDFAGKTSYMTNEETIEFDETQGSKIQEWLASLDFTLAKNMEKFYFNNELELDYENETAKAYIQSNNSTFDVHRNHLIRGFKNKLEYVPALRNGDIIQFSWYINYGSKPQNLQIYPGVFTNILNNELNYESTAQEVEVPSWLTNLSLGYRLPKGRIGQYYSINATVDKQNLRSSINLGVDDNNIRLEDIATQNNMNWLRSSLDFRATYDYTHHKFSSQLILPVALQYTSYKDNLHQLNENQNKVLFNPSFFSKYAFNPENELSFNYQRQNTFGNIENVYRGLIIRNYRAISSNTSGINEAVNNNFGLHFKTGKTVKLMFYNVRLNYSKSLSSTMISNQIDNDISQVVLVERENEVKNYSIYAGFDKYLFNLASTLKINSSINWTDYNQLFNGELLPFLNTTYTLSPNIEARILRKINLSYFGNLSWTTTQQVDDGNQLNQNTFNINQNLSFPINLLNNIHLRISGRYLYSHQRNLKDINYFFIDSFVRYTYKKWKTDFELNVTNIANIKHFDTYFVSSNMQSQNSYQLRGRMAVLKAVFNFSQKTN